MNKDQKKNYISEMKEFFNSNDSVLVTHYQGLTVNQLDELRIEMRNHGMMFKITKNRITKLALKDTKCEGISDLFSGPTAIALSNDAISSAKILTKFSACLTDKRLSIIFFARKYALSKPTKIFA